MARIYPDTNRFVDFYQAASDSISVFDELRKYKTRLVITDQTIVEFRRNRVSTLNWLAGQFTKSMDVSTPYTTAILRALPIHKELTELLSAYKKKGEEVSKHIRALISDEAQDPVAQSFLQLARDADVLRIALSDDVIARAQRRKLLGNPPSSPDKYTVGDEVIWEMLLANLREDLIIVTKDKTYHHNLSLLGEEFRERTGRTLLLVTERFSEALRKVGEVPAERLIEAEDRARERAKSRITREWDVALTPETREAMLEKEICPRCGRKGRMCGYDGSDGDSFDWFECSCGVFIPLTGL